MDRKLFKSRMSTSTTNPHGILGLHDDRIIYQFSPNMKEHAISVKGKEQEMKLIDSQGFFVYESNSDLNSQDYEIFHSDGSKGFDPYNFSPSFSLVDGHLLSEEKHLSLYDALGSHFCEHDGVEGTRFAVYAPNARCVHLRCDLGNWREKIYPMRQVFDTGVFELFIPGFHDGMMYKYAICTKDYQTILKSDPYARRFEMRPNTASIVHKVKDFNWTDDEWLKKRKAANASDPMNIYELHLGAWCKTTRFPNFKQIASEVALYVKEMGYTHVELLPIKEHPLDESWGYQPSGYFAPTSRYGTPDDFKYFVNHMHTMGIGVVFDFVPAHFPKDESFLSHFDGEALFEHPDPVMKNHPVWDTLIFNYGSRKVKNFLISSALFWVEKMHIDMIRVDAVHSILYLDYGRWGQDFEKNHLGGVENIEGIDFLKELNQAIEEKHPDVAMIAEDSSYHKDVTKDQKLGGLGFSMKWNVGWFADLCRYLLLTEEERQSNKLDILNSYKEVFHEKYMLSISHDDTVKANFSDDVNEQMSYQRLMYSIAIAHPGKKLFFMGTEVGDSSQFDEKLSWRKSPLKNHASIKHKGFVKEMNHLYLNEKALHEIDFDEKGFAWIDYSDYNPNVICFVRKSALERLLVIHNFSKESYENYLVSIPGVTSIKEVFNSDEKRFGGEGVLNPQIQIQKDQKGIYLNVPKLGTVICKVVLDVKKCIL
ncbi:MAG: 1,4-alpha-glucan branching enzyme GlgB [Chlamydiia bacterium]|nr:1,4-alpha-glucan branching enzyme GlgB [Chlamydiia bacterium]